MLVVYELLEGLLEIRRQDAVFDLARTILLDPERVVTDIHNVVLSSIHYHITSRRRTYTLLS